MRVKRVISILVICIMCISFCIPSGAASGTAKVYYNSSLSVGTTSGINSHLTTMGYSSTRSSLPTVNTLKSQLSSAKVIHILTHGNAGSTTCSDGSLAHTSIGTTSNLKFAFLETCYSGTTSGSYSTAGKIKSNGASATIGFDGTISASTASNGSHYFALVFYATAINGYTVQQSASSALSQLYSNQGSYYGCQNYVVFGGSTKIN